ncbi:MAG: hypothetical protein WCI74_07420 [Actinomycetes bacterium]
MADPYAKGELCIGARDCERVPVAWLMTRTTSHRPNVLVLEPIKDGRYSRGSTYPLCAVHVGPYVDSWVSFISDPERVQRAQRMPRVNRDA